MPAQPPQIRAPEEYRNEVVVASLFSVCSGGIPQLEEDRIQLREFPLSSVDDAQREYHYDDVGKIYFCFPRSYLAGGASYHAATYAFLRDCKADPGLAEAASAAPESEKVFLIKKIVPGSGCGHYLTGALLWCKDCALENGFGADPYGIDDIGVIGAYKLRLAAEARQAARKAGTGLGASARSEKEARDGGANAPADAEPGERGGQARPGSGGPAEGEESGSDILDLEGPVTDVSGDDSDSESLSGDARGPLADAAAANADVPRFGLINRAGGPASLTPREKALHNMAQGRAPAPLNGDHSFELMETLKDALQQRGFVPCRFCHDELAKDHSFHAHDRPPEEMVMKCLNCLHTVPFGAKCQRCGARVAENLCEQCYLLSLVGSEAKPFHHCEKCGSCVVGAAEELRHCDECGRCYPAAAFDGHDCVREIGSCIICLESLDASIIPYTLMGCGSHYAHVHCYKDMIQHGDLHCPLCRRRIVLD